MSSVCSSRAVSLRPTKGLESAADVVDGAGTGLVQAGLGGLDEIDDHEIDHPADDLVHEAALAEVGLSGDHGVVLAPEEADLP